MKKEELTALNLTDEQINGVQALNGRDVNAAKDSATKERDSYYATVTQERDNYRSQYEAAAESLKKFEGVDPDKLTGEIKKLNDKLAKQEEGFKKQWEARDFNDKLNTAIRKAGGRVEKTIVPLLDVDALRNSKEQDKAIESAIGEIKKTHGFLFGVDEPFANPVGGTGGSKGDKDEKAVDMAKIRSIMGLPPEKKATK